jgi:hypothetical protein
MTWKSIERFSKYEISSSGKIRNATTKKVLTENGESIRLNTGDDRERVSICQIYAETFMEIPRFYNPKKFSVRVIDHKLSPFSGTNLEWDRTPCESRHSPASENARTAKLVPDDVLTIRDLYRTGKTQADIARMYKCTQENIHFIVRRKTWKRV